MLRRDLLAAACLPALRLRAAISSLKISRFATQKHTLNGRDFLFLEIHTDGGLVGLGEGSLPGRAAIVEEAIRWLEPLDGQLVRVGGSHAQWEVFEDTLLQAYLRAGQLERAEALLRRRLARRSSARDVVWLEQATATQASGSS